MGLRTSLGSLCFSLGMVTEFTSRPHTWRLVSIGIGGFRYKSRQSLFRLIAGIFGREVTSMSDVYVCICVYASKHARLGVSGGMLPQEIF